MEGKHKALAVPLTPQEWADHREAPSALDISQIEDEKGVKLKVGRQRPRPVMANSFEAREGASMTGHDEDTSHEGGI